MEKGKKERKKKKEAPAVMKKFGIPARTARHVQITRERKENGEGSRDRGVARLLWCSCLMVVLKQESSGRVLIL